MLVYRKGEVSEDVFYNLPDYLPKGALMSSTVPALFLLPFLRTAVPSSQSNLGVIFFFAKAMVIPSLAVFFNITSPPE